MPWNPDLIASWAGAAVAGVCGWSLLQIGRSGALRGRMGGTWTRAERPGLYWLTAAVLAAGLWAGALILADALGAPRPPAAAVATAVAAAALTVLAAFGRQSRPP